MSNTTTATVAMIAAEYNVDGSTVRRWTTKRHDPTCPHAKDATGRLRFDPDEVRRWWTRHIGSNGTAQTGHRPTPADDRVTIIEAYNMPHTDDVEAFDKSVQLAVLVARHHSLPLPDPTAGKLELLQALATLPKQARDTWLDMLDEAIDKLREVAR